MEDDIKIMTYDTKKKKVVEGGIFKKHDLSFHKFVNDKHYMKIRAGYGISEDIIQQLVGLMCVDVYAHRPEESRRIPFPFYLRAKVEDFGSGPQRFFAWKKMETVNSKQMEVFNAKTSSQGLLRKKTDGAGEAKQENTNNA